MKEFEEEIFQSIWNMIEKHKENIRPGDFFLRYVAALASCAFNTSSDMDEVEKLLIKTIAEVKQIAKATDEQETLGEGS